MVCLFRPRNKTVVVRLVSYKRAAASVFTRAAAPTGFLGRRSLSCVAMADDDDVCLEGNGVCLDGNDDDDDDLCLEGNDDDNDDLCLEENDEDGESLCLEENAQDSEDELLLEDNPEGAADDEASASDLEGNATVPAMTVSDLKDLGNAAFKKEEVDTALSYYNAALAEAANIASEENASERSILLINRAACALKLADWPAAINDCTAALSMGAASSSTRRKALYRRASAFAESGDIDGAQRDVSQLPSEDVSTVKLAARLSAMRSDAQRGNSQATVPAEAPRPPRPPRQPAATPPAHRRRVSCISPTTPERALFHETVRAFRTARLPVLRPPPFHS